MYKVPTILLFLSLLLFYIFIRVHLVLHPHEIPKVGFVVAGGGFYSYYIHQGKKTDKEWKIVRKKLSFMHTKRLNTFFKRWVQFRVGAIPRLPFIRLIAPFPQREGMTSNLSILYISSYSD